jgi:hypothetical protein
MFEVFEKNYTSFDNKGLIVIFITFSAYTKSTSLCVFDPFEPISFQPIFVIQKIEQYVPGLVKI